MKTTLNHSLLALIGQVLKLLWLKKITLALSSIYLVAVTIMWIQTAMNPPPAPSALKTFKVLITSPYQIVSAYQLKPHMRGALEDGSTIKLVFPSPFTLTGLTGKGGYFEGVAPEVRKSYVGCQAQVSGVPLRYVVDDFFRVWSFQCDETNFKYADAVKQFQKSQEDIDFFHRLSHLLFGLVLSLFFYIERKRK